MENRIMPTSSLRRVFLDRRSESEALEELLDAVRGGESRALVLCGEAGVGKTALLDSAVERASGFRVARAAGVQSEMELPFAALHQLCAPMLDRLERLPGPQRDALGTAFALIDGHAPDRFYVGLAVLSLLSETADERPLLCVIDDAQWCDVSSAHALAFAARRLGRESVGVVLVMREPSEEFAGLPELVLHGLDQDHARVLLDSAIAGPLDARVRDRIIAEARGNPLALLELPRGLVPAEVAGEFGLQASQPLSGRIERSFVRRLEELPAQTQLLLLVAASEPVGDPVLMWRAAGRMGIAPQAVAPAVSAGLLTLGARVTFAHPLVRSAVYRAASSEARCAVHRALANVTDPELDPDRRAWHRAQATSGPDEDVASELERSAGRAQARGGLAAAAAFLERSAELTLEPSRRAERTLAAAQAMHQAGGLDGALGLLDTAQVGPLDALSRARVDVLRAQISFDSSRGSEAPPLLLKAAKRLEPLDVGLAREIYLDAVAAAVFAGRLAAGTGVQEVAEAVREAPPSPEPRSGPALLLEGFTALVIEGHCAGAPLLKRALSAFCSDALSADQALRWLGVACTAAGLVWDYASWDVLSERLVKLARDSGALTQLPMGLSTRAGVHLLAGELTLAGSLAEEVSAVIESTGSSIAAYAALALVAFQGRESEASELIEAGRKEVLRRGEGAALTFVYWATALLHNGVGRYESAFAAAEEAGEDSNTSWFHSWGLVELVEAGARTRRNERAADALARLSEVTLPSGTDWALGVQARSRALLSDGGEAEALYREALERLGRTRVRVDFARAHLLYGEWLRRENRRIDAREQLHQALDAFTSMGMEGFAGRAARELLATGETVHKSRVDTDDHLTPQEAQIAHLASEGLSNPEISARLFISRRTVEYHLHKVFSKLGISSRNQLQRALGGERSSRRVIDRTSDSHA
jgi:DNA-binding CsgD family transcriptional regulator